MPGAAGPADAAKDDAPARHIRLTSHPSGGEAMPGATPPVAWGAVNGAIRGPVVGTTSNRSHRNVIGTHSGSYGIYRALAVAAGSLKKAHRADLTDTSPTDVIGPHPSWFDAASGVAIWRLISP